MQTLFALLPLLQTLTLTVSAAAVGFVTAVNDVQLQSALLGSENGNPYLVARQQTTQADNSRCGPVNQNQTCGFGLCCSYAGFCGTGNDFCSVPQNCQRNYGFCDSNITPPGANTSSDARSRTGPVPYGQLIFNCTMPQTIALTYDDAPSNNTEALLDILRDAGANATFFVSGNTNAKGQIDKTPEWIAAVKRMDAEGHQIASHTWSHPDLDQLSSEDRQLEMRKNERAIANILNKYPTYMRPPYMRCSNETGCLNDMKTLGYHVVMNSVDSNDWMHPRNLTDMIKTFELGLNQTTPDDGNMLLMQHERFVTSALNLTRHALTTVAQRGWKVVTVADCLGDDPQHQYRIPSWTESDAMATDGCVISSNGFCGTLDAFQTKQECVDSNKRCYTQVDDCNNASKGAACGDMKNICDSQSSFCQSCGTSAENTCEMKGFGFTNTA